MEETDLVAHDDTIILDITDDSIIIDKVVIFKSRPRLQERSRRCFLFHCLLRWNDRKFEDCYDELLLKIMITSKPIMAVMCQLLNNSHFEFCANWNPIRIRTKYGYHLVIDSKILLIFHLCVQFHISSIELPMHFRSKLKNKVVSTLECLKVLRKKNSDFSGLDYDVFKLLLFGRILKCNSEFNLIYCFPHHLRDLPSTLRTKVLRLQYSSLSGIEDVKADFYARKLSLPYFEDTKISQKMIPSGIIRSSISEVEVMMTMECRGQVESDYIKQFTVYHTQLPRVKNYVVKLRLHIYPACPLNTFQISKNNSLSSEVLSRWNKAGLNITLEIRYQIIVDNNICLDEEYVVTHLRRIIFGDVCITTTKNGDYCEMQDLNTNLTVKLLY